jgi:hypothetical protein
VTGRRRLELNRELNEVFELSTRRGIQRQTWVSVDEQFAQNSDSQGTEEELQEIELVD